MALQVPDKMCVCVYVCVCVCVCIRERHKEKEAVGMGISTASFTWEYLMNCEIKIIDPIEEHASKSAQIDLSLNISLRHVPFS